jgi:hypothetical protein
MGRCKTWRPHLLLLVRPPCSRAPSHISKAERISRSNKLQSSANSLVSNDGQLCSTLVFFPTAARVAILRFPASRCNRLPSSGLKCRCNSHRPPPVAPNLWLKASFSQTVKGRQIILQQCKLAAPWPRNSLGFEFSSCTSLVARDLGSCLCCRSLYQRSSQTSRVAPRIERFLK